MLFKDSSPFFRRAFLIVMALIVIAMGSYVASLQYAQKKLSLFKWYEPPYVSNTEGVPTNTFRAGDAFIVNVFVEREPLKCWATYINLLQGELASHQFPPQRSQIITDKRSRVVLHVFQEIPEKLPAGEYKLYQLVYPTCTGYDLPPFRTDMGITMTILEPDAPKPLVVRVERPEPAIPDLEIDPNEEGEYLVPAA